MLAIFMVNGPSTHRQNHIIHIVSISLAATGVHVDPILIRLNLQTNFTETCNIIVNVVLLLLLLLLLFVDVVIYMCFNAMISDPVIMTKLNVCLITLAPLPENK